MTNKATTPAKPATATEIKRDTKEANAAAAEASADVVPASVPETGDASQVATSLTASPQLAAADVPEDDDGTKVKRHRVRFEQFDLGGQYTPYVEELTDVERTAWEADLATRGDRRAVTWELIAPAA